MYFSAACADGVGQRTTDVAVPAVRHHRRVVIGPAWAAFGEAMEALVASPATSPLLTRERVSPLYFFSYTFIPLSSIAFPHICIFCLTAQERDGYFRKTIVL